MLYWLIVAPAARAFWQKCREKKNTIISVPFFFSFLVLYNMKAWIFYPRLPALSINYCTRKHSLWSNLFIGDGRLYLICLRPKENTYIFFFKLSFSNRNFPSLSLVLSSFFVDAVPIRVYKNNEVKGVAYPNSQPMGIYSTIWNADDWATRGGLEKIDWSRAPFYAYYKDFDIEACSTSGWLSHCSSTASNWWDTPSYQQLGPIQARLYRWVRTNHMVYDYCSDKSRYPVSPPECLAGIWFMSVVRSLCVCCDMIRCKHLYTISVCSYVYTIW